ncbi:MAG TPA: hypothetical protein VKU01_36115 [Bryobacteraceae bacterium]|nr:hypothetical protein [Bryobacteraceae bacterium]
MMSRIENISTATEQNCLTAHGTPSQNAVADWVGRELDHPLRDSQEELSECQVAGDPDDVVQVFPLRHVNSVQELQEIAVLVRSELDIRQFMSYDRLRVVVYRGTAAQAKAAEWLLRQLDMPESGTKALKGQEFPESTPADGIKLFFLNPDHSVQQFQELVNVVRSISDMRFAFTYNSRRALAVRGTSDQITLVGWLLNHLENSGPGPDASPEYRVADTRTPDNVVRVLHLPQTLSDQSFQAAAQNLRITSQARWLFTYAPDRVVAVRGTASQIALVEQLAEQGNQPVIK